LGCWGGSSGASRSHCASVSSRSVRAIATNTTNPINQQHSTHALVRLQDNRRCGRFWERPSGSGQLPAPVGPPPERLAAWVPPPCLRRGAVRLPGVQPRVLRALRRAWPGCAGAGGARGQGAQLDLASGPSRSGTGRGLWRRLRGRWPGLGPGGTRGGPARRPSRPRPNEADMSRRSPLGATYLRILVRRAGRVGEAQLPQHPSGQ